MVSTLALIILIVILGGIIIFSLIKSVLRAGLSFIFLFLVLSVVLGFFFVQDASDFKDTFFSEPSTYVLEDNGTLLSAFSLLAMNMSTFETVSIGDASQIILDEGPGKVFIMNKDVLDLSSDEQVKNLTGLGFEDAFSADDDRVRASAFLIAMVSTFNQEKKTFVFKQVRKGNLAILPKTFAVKLMTFDASSYVDKVKAIVVSERDAIVSTVNDTISIFNETNNS